MKHETPRSPGLPVFVLAGTLVLALSYSSTKAGDILPSQVFPSQVGLLVEYYEVDHAALPPLLREYQKQPDAENLLKQMQEMAKKGDARMVESAYVVTRSGQRAKIESIREYIYPTEFDPAEVPQKLFGPVDKDTVMITPATPTAYEMRPVGNTLEVDPVVSEDGTFVELNVAPELVEFHGFKIWGHDASATPQPLFHTMKTDTSLTSNFGSCELFAVLTPSASHAKNGGGKRVLGFISPTRMVAASRADLDAFRKDPAKWVEKHQVTIPSEPAEVPDPFAEGAGEEPEPKRPQQISLLTEYIEVDAALASQIARQLQTSADATAIRRRLDGMIGSGKARLLESNTVLTRSGQRAKTESTREFIYPTEYNPPEIPQEIHGPVDRDADFTASVGATSFRSRGLGLIVEADPVLSVDSRVIELNLAPETTSLAGELTYGTGPSASEQPLFETLKISTAVVVADGTSLLLGIHSLESARAAEAGTEEAQKTARDRRVLVFVTAAVKTLK